MNYKSQSIFFVKNKKRISPITIANEYPLSIKIQGKFYSIIMRTPGEEIEHAIGFCLSEGIITKSENISSIGLSKNKQNNLISITLKEKKNEKTNNLIKRKIFISNTSCGICGKVVASDISNFTKPIKKDVIIEPHKIIQNLLELYKFQPIRKTTRSTHCSRIFDKNFNFLSSSEDIGRHNALDKSIGSLIIRNKIEKAKIIILSSRISYELVQKAAKAKIPILSAISRPTSLSIELALRLGITLASLSPNNNLMIYSNEYRLK